METYLVPGSMLSTSHTFFFHLLPQQCYEGDAIIIPTLQMRTRSQWGCSGAPDPNSTCLILMGPCFSDEHVHEPPGDLSKMQILKGLRWGPRSSISHKLPVGARAAGLQTTVHVARLPSRCWCGPAWEEGPSPAFHQMCLWAPSLPVSKPAVLQLLCSSIAATREDVGFGRRNTSLFCSYNWQQWGKDKWRRKIIE